MHSHAADRVERYGYGRRPWCCAYSLVCLVRHQHGVEQGYQRGFAGVFTGFAVSSCRDRAAGLVYFGGVGREIDGQERADQDRAEAWSCRRG